MSETSTKAPTDQKQVLIVEDDENILEALTSEVPDGLNVAFIQKPFSLRVLNKRLDELLSEAAE